MQTNLALWVDVGSQLWRVGQTAKFRDLPIGFARVPVWSNSCMAKVSYRSSTVGRQISPSPRNARILRSLLCCMPFETHSSRTFMLDARLGPRRVHLTM